MLCKLLDTPADYILYGEPSPSAQTIAGLLTGRDERTQRLVESTVRAMLTALDEPQPYRTTNRPERIPSPGGFSVIPQISPPFSSGGGRSDGSGRSSWRAVPPPGSPAGAPQQACRPDGGVPAF